MRKSTFALSRVGKLTRISFLIRSFKSRHCSRIEMAIIPSQPVSSDWKHPQLELPETLHTREGEIDRPHCSFLYMKMNEWFWILSGHVRVRDFFPQKQRFLPNGCTNNTDTSRNPFSLPKSRRSAGMLFPPPESDRSLTDSHFERNSRRHENTLPDTQPFRNTRLELMLSVNKERLIDAIFPKLESTTGLWGERFFFNPWIPSLILLIKIWMLRDFFIQSQCGESASFVGTLQKKNRVHERTLCFMLVLYACRDETAAFLFLGFRPLFLPDFFHFVRVSWKCVHTYLCFFSLSLANSCRYMIRGRGAIARIIFPHFFWKIFCNYSKANVGQFSSSRARTLCSHLLRIRHIRTHALSSGKKRIGTAEIVAGQKKNPAHESHNIRGGKRNN